MSSNPDNKDFFVDFSDTEFTVESDDTSSFVEVPPIAYDTLFEKGKILRENDLSIQSGLNVSSEKKEENEFLIVDEEFAETDFTATETEFHKNDTLISALEKSWDEPIDEPEVVEWKMEETLSDENPEWEKEEALDLPDTNMEDNPLSDIFMETENPLHEIPEVTPQNENVPVYAHWIDPVTEEMPQILPVTDLILEDVLKISSEETVPVVQEIPALQEGNREEGTQEICLYKGKYKIIIPVSEDEKNTYFQTLPPLSQPGTDTETDSLIDRFLKNEPKLTLKSGAEYTPPAVIAGDEEEEDEIVTETMAKIMVFQGKKQEAIKIYKRLSLEFPEKSSYFATLIEQLQ